MKRRVLGNDPFEKGAAERAPVEAPAKPPVAKAKPAAAKAAKPAKRAGERPLPQTPELQTPKARAAAKAPPERPTKPERAARPPAKAPRAQPTAKPAPAPVIIEPARVTTFPRASPLRPPPSSLRAAPVDVDTVSDAPVRASPMRPVARHTAPPPGPRASPAPPPRYEEETVSRETPLPEEPPATVPYAAALDGEGTAGATARRVEPSWEVPHGTGAVRAVVGGLWQAARALVRPTAQSGWGRDEGLARALHPLGVFLFERYWRVQVEGAELVPAGGCLLVANQSGALPLGGPVLALAVERHRPELERVRWVLDAEVLRTPVGSLGRRLGAVEHTRENVLALLAERRPVALFPEGQAGLMRSFAGQRQLKPFAQDDYVAIAATAQVPIVPVAIVGGERAFPYLGTVPLGERQVPLTVPPLPVQWRVQFGRPISFPSIAAARADDRTFVDAQNAAVRDAVTAMLHELWAG